jgi:hypothetical protein
MWVNGWLKGPVVTLIHPAPPFALGSGDFSPSSFGFAKEVAHEFIHRSLAAT